MLFENTKEPLAITLRPKTFEEVVGQKKIISILNLTKWIFTWFFIKYSDVAKNNGIVIPRDNPAISPLIGMSASRDWSDCCIKLLLIAD